MKIWVVGPIAWDSVYFLDRSFEESGYIHSRKRSERPGGQGLNVAAGLKGATLDVELIGYLGNDENANKLKLAIEDHTLSIDFITTFEYPTPHIMVLVDVKGERKMVGLQESHYEKVRIPTQKVQSGDLVVWTWWRDQFKEDFLACKAKGARTVVGLAALRDPNIAADLFIGSANELPDNDLSMRNFPSDREVIITNGAAGATYFYDNKVIEVPAQQVEVVDTTGAGDALLSGVLYGIASGFDMEKSLRVGVNWSSATISNESSLPAKWSEKYIIS